MDDRTKAPEPNEPPRLADELATIVDEPLLPIEKQLVAGSLILGVVLLGILVWLSQTYFPIPTTPPK